jgi:serine protease AprX
MLPKFSAPIAFITVALVATTAHAAARPPAQKIDKSVKRLVATGVARQRVIITANAGCRDVVRQALQQHGAAIVREFGLIDAFNSDISSTDVSDYANNTCVRTIAADAPVRSTATSSSNGLTSTLRDTLGLPHFASLDSSMPTGATGVSVAIVDSGITPSADFGGRITGFFDFTHGGISTTPYDDYGHGTHIAGLIGSNGALSNYEFQGVAPDVHLVGLKVLDSTGAGKTSDVIAALDFLLTFKQVRAHVVNLSLGHPIFAPAADDPLVQAVERVSAAGIIVVTAAGNYGQTQGSGTGQIGYTGITSPCNAPSAICVGAVDTKNSTDRSDDSVAPYSSRGPSWFDATEKPDLVAPGHRLFSDTSLTSPLWTQLPGNQGYSQNGQALLRLSGTSMAAGVTSGVVALVLQAHNQNGFHRQIVLTPNLVKAILQFSAIPLAGADYLTQGAGEINAAGAIALARAIDTSQAVGSWWLGSGVTPSTTIAGASLPWSQHVIYGSTVLAGSVVYSNNIIWGSNVIWGSTHTGSWGANVFVLDDNIIWGTDIIWGTNIVWSTRVLGQRVGGTNIIWGTDIIWGTNIIWGTLDNNNIVWGTDVGGNIIWGTDFVDNIVWGTTTSAGDNIIWGTNVDDNIIWGTSDDDNILWGTSADVF